MYKEQSPALEKHKDYEVIKSYKLPLRIKDGSISSFDITYVEFPSGKYHVLSKGEVTGSENVPVRINSECIWGRFGSAQCDCNEQYEEEKRVIAEEGLGMIIFAHDQIGKNVGLREHALINSEANLQKGNKELYEVDIWAKPFVQYGGQLDYRDYTDVAEIIKYFGPKSIELLTNNPSKIEAMKKNGIYVAKRRPLVVPITEFNDIELRVKKDIGGHLL